MHELLCMAFASVGSVDVYISCVLCFQSGGGERAKMQEEKNGMVETDMAWKSTGCRGSGR